MAIDVDHESMLGGSTAAYAWIDRIEYVAPDSDEERAPGFWGHVESWTPEGQMLVAHRKFRGISPVVRIAYPKDEAHAADDLPELVAFLNAALTNRPNLKITLLNTEETPASAPMPSIPPRLAPAPAPEPEPGQSEWRQAMDFIRHQNESAYTQSLEMERVRSEMHRLHQARIREALDTLIATHSRRGALPPAQHAFYREMVVDEASLERVRKHMEAMPVILEPGPVSFHLQSNADHEGNAADRVGLSPEEKHVADKMGLPHEWMLKSKREGLK